MRKQTKVIHRLERVACAEKILEITPEMNADDPVVQTISPVKRLTERFEGTFFSRFFSKSPEAPLTRPIRVRGYSIGVKGVTLMAGPREIQSPEQMLAIGRALKGAGVRFLRARACGDRSFGGEVLGLHESNLKLLSATAKRFGLQLVTEVFGSSDINLAEKYADMLEIGPENTKNHKLLLEAGYTDRTVILHRSPMMSVADFFDSLSSLERGGTAKIIAADNGVRGVSSGNERFLDLEAIATYRRQTSHPVFVNCSGIARNWSNIGSVVLAAVASGVDGVMVELPNEDGTIDEAASELAGLMKRVQAVKSTLNAFLHHRRE